MSLFDRMEEGAKRLYFTLLIGALCSKIRETKVAVKRTEHAHDLKLIVYRQQLINLLECNQATLTVLLDSNPLAEEGYARCKKASLI